MSEFILGLFAGMALLPLLIADNGEKEILIYGILNTYGDFPDDLLPEHLKKPL